MKKVLLLLAVIGTMGAANAQSSTNVERWDGVPTIGRDRMMVDNLPDVITIKIHHKFLSSQYHVTVDAGQHTALINFASRKNYYLVKGTDEGPKGMNNRIEFNSKSAVINYFNMLGYDYNSDMDELGGRTLSGRKLTLYKKMM